MVLTENIHMLTGADSLDKIRIAFYPLSQTLVRIVETFGGDVETPLYVQYCPMAFGNAGAPWLATSEEINNPYFGAMMLRCGEVQKQITQ